MGNCQAAIAIDNAHSGGANCNSPSGQWGRKKKKKKIGDGSPTAEPHRKFDHYKNKKERLLAAPGRIFSNDGWSSTASLYTQQGRKGVNQDAMILWQDFAGEGSVFCGVFDGHGPQGHMVARQVRDALPLKLLSFFPKPRRATRSSLAGGLVSGCFVGTDGGGESDPNARRGEDEFSCHSAWREAFVRSYKAMDKELHRHTTVDCFCSGSTAVTLLKLGSKLFVGNIGDSRAVLATKNENDGSLVSIQLTVDLKPNLPSEEERIKRCKGRVFALQDEPEVQRVWLPFDNAPGLAMARAFGDFCLKDYGVISVPEFFSRTLTEKDQFVVLASDGVWDVLSNKEVVDIISSSPRRSTAAKLLVQAASREWKLKFPTARMDDCAVVCLYLDGKIETESESLENSLSTAVSCSFEDSCNESGTTQSCEPTLDRNFTVRSSGHDRVSFLVEDVESSEDHNWSSIEGVVRVNSIVQLPRFSDEKAKL